MLSLLPPEAVLFGLFGLMLAAAAAAAALGGGGLVSYGYLVRVHVVDTVPVPRLASAPTAGPARLDRLHLGSVTRRLLVLVQGLAYALGHFHGTSEGDGAATRLLLLLLAACGLLVD